MAQTLTPERPAETSERLAVVDTDVHPTILPTDEAVSKHLSRRWRDYLAMIGIRDFSTERTIPPQRKFTHRTDAVDESGRPSTIPSFTRHQLLDGFDMSAAILNDTQGVMFLKGNGNFPQQLMMELCRAYTTTRTASCGWPTTRASTHPSTSR